MDMSLLLPLCSALESTYYQVFVRLHSYEKNKVFQIWTKVDRNNGEEIGLD